MVPDSPRVRLAFKYLADLALWSLAAPIAFWLRLDGLPETFWSAIIRYALFGLIVKGVLIYVLRLHRQSWRRLSIPDLVALGQAVGLATLILMALGFTLFQDVILPRSVPPVDGLLGLVMLGGMRLVLRMSYEAPLRWTFRRRGKRALIVGAGDAGTMIAREMVLHPEGEYFPVGFLDDDPAKLHERFMGLETLGAIQDLPRVVSEYQADEVLIAIPSAPGSVIRRVVNLARNSGVTHRIIPGVYQILSGKVLISQIREVDLEDLLRREPVRLDISEIASYLKGRSVMVTGAGGSIGSELVRQIAGFQPAQLLLLGHGEHSLFQIDQELRRDWAGIPRQIIVTSLQRREKLNDILRSHRAEVIFHAAAHKHVPMMESNPDEAVYNNVGGTRNLLSAALSAEVKRFVNVSTDKAVRPTSVMGASKRVAEYLVESASRRAPEGSVFASVRFGNVLGSRGSVVPLFKEQIKAGGPVTITDPEMSRFFMTIPEAAQLVLQAGGYNQNGAVYVLDMGEPVKITTLARDLIELSGLIPDEDIPIIVSGRRAGEKLYEEPLPREEGMRPSSHPKIYAAPGSGMPEAELDAAIGQLLNAAIKSDIPGLMETLKQLVPSYVPYVPQARADNPTTESASAQYT